ncbi:MAG: GYD domain-containing protein [Micromonosporaceae bacterium]
MATYVALINWTDKGIQNYRDTLDRANKAAELGKSMNVNLKEIYWTLGQYDIVAIMEGPDDETATAFALALGSQGNVRTTSLRAFTSDEMAVVVQRAGG